MCLPNDCCDSSQGSCGYGLCLNGRLADCFPRAVPQPPPCHSSTRPCSTCPWACWAVLTHWAGLCDSGSSGSAPSTCPPGQQRERVLCLCPGACTALLHFLATKLQPPCQSTLPCASACLSKQTSLVSNPLFSPRQLQLFPNLCFSFPLASLRYISALAHSWYQAHCKGLWFMWKEGRPEGQIPKHLPQDFLQKGYQSIWGKGFSTRQLVSFLKSCLS